MQDRPIANRYQLQGVLGNGGMATVYRARDIVLDRAVAVKVMDEKLSDDEEFVKRFILEARANGRLSQPNIVNVYDAGNIGKTYYMVMELIDGITLHELIEQKGGRLPEREAIAIAMQICEGLSHAHQNGIIHRDVKPLNIMCTSEGKFKLTDFGIARLSQMANSITKTGTVMGSVHYFSPEQASDQEISAASDLYSLGIVLYEMVTGEVPFDAPENLQVAYQHLDAPVPDPRAKNPELSEEFCQIIFKTLEKKPEDRYQTAKELKQALQPVYFGKFHRKEKSARKVEENGIQLSAQEAASLSRNRQSSGEWKNYVIGIAVAAIIVLTILLFQIGGSS
ncbi:protein kinase domain-containing protein [Risungbinella massiliensis]|uniref:protein kinase domain-containing protein n=1 Tax=Risungbinella massiliensis TaxID=1329796 RepID=UPI000699E0BB|nr:protein kinase [Risungbinella massiliensis]